MFFIFWVYEFISVNKTDCINKELFNEKIIYSIIDCRFGGAKR
ncbi:hypothetical protein A4U88_2521 [Serratia marcescens]|nr:hypothetical protein A4U88_2521 [Serratia marcescens]